MSFHTGFLPHSTQRIILRRFAIADLDRFLAYRHDPQVAQFQSWSSFSRDQAKSFILEMNEATVGVVGEWFQIAITHKQSNLLIGDIGIQLRAADPTTAEIGFTLAREYQNQGYAQEAVQVLINRLFETENITKVVGITDVRNQPSINLLRRLGMALVRVESVEFKGEQCVEQTFELDKQKRDNP